jgi:hypothetical protein
MLWTVCENLDLPNDEIPAGVRSMAGEHRGDLWMAIPGDVPDGLCLETEVECRTGSLTVRIQAWMWSSTRTALLPAQCVTSREPSTTNETPVVHTLTQGAHIQHSCDQIYVTLRSPIQAGDS